MRGSFAVCSVHGQESHGANRRIEGRFNRLGRNGDGVLTAREARGAPQFREIDADNDGKVTPAEVRAWRRAQREESRQPGAMDGELPEDAAHAKSIFRLAYIHKGSLAQAAARSNGLDLYRSDDDAKTWTHRQKLTGPQQHPGHFTRLADGRVLLSYGNRAEPKGVDVRISRDEGETWSEPVRAVDFQGDGGYPSSVPLPDGHVLTAYYASRIAAHRGYHMGVVIWDPAVSFRGIELPGSGR